MSAIASQGITMWQPCRQSASPAAISVHHVRPTRPTVGHAQAQAGVLRLAVLARPSSTTTGSRLPALPAITRAGPVRMPVRVPLAMRALISE